MSTPRREASARRAAMKSMGWSSQPAIITSLRAVQPRNMSGAWMQLPAGMCQPERLRVAREEQSANISPNNVIFDTSQPDRSRVTMFAHEENMPSMVFTFDTFQFFMSRVWSAAQSANRRCMFVTFDTSQFAASIF